MSSVWHNHAQQLATMIDANEDTLAHIFMERVMLLPVDIQDKIIDDICQLEHCNKDAIAAIINDYSIMEIK